MNVAVRRFQQSPMLGHAALSHTVWSFSVSTNSFKLR
jgi:hypothetical protein